MTDDETIGAQLELLLRAGTVSFPEQARSIADTATSIGEIHGRWFAPTVRAGSPTALVKAREVNADVHRLLRRAALSWQDAAHALVAIARDFEATDARAAAAARRIGRGLRDAEVPAMSEPPTLEEIER